MNQNEKDLFLLLCRYRGIDRKNLSRLIDDGAATPEVLGTLLANRMGGVAHHTLKESALLDRADREFRNTLRNVALLNEKMNEDFFACLKMLSAEYDENGMLRKTKYADESCLQRYLYEEFAANEQIGTIEETTYNSFKEPTLIVSSEYDVPCCDCNCPSEQTSVEYIYNDNRKLIEKRTTHCYGCCAETNDATVAVVKYFYDNAGEVVRTESYVEGEELKTGVTGGTVLPPDRVLQFGSDHVKQKIVHRSSLLNQIVQV